MANVDNSPDYVVAKQFNAKAGETVSHAGVQASND